MLSGSPSRILNVNRMDVAYRSTSGSNPPTPPPLSEERDEVILLASVILSEVQGIVEGRGMVILLLLRWWLL